MDKDNEHKEEIGDKTKQPPTEEEERLVESGEALKDAAETTHDTKEGETQGILDNMGEKISGARNDVRFAFFY
ncbi:unnamed protein product [Cylicostephanus goldi]|uniref:Uncharacterized protein n=1 Tax=Cylicostephanus goldi TaxID=71465 RepID=A0A3P6RDS4_CYLGO|nr:unnamed protein product [Cylicostephanus goldi]